MKLKCDHCKNEFEVNNLSIEKVSGDIERMFFVCNSCGHDYTSYYSNYKVKALQLEMKKLDDAKPKTHRQMKGWIQRRNTLKKKIKKEMDELRTKWSVASG